MTFTLDERSNEHNSLMKIADVAVFFQTLPHYLLFQVLCVLVSLLTLTFLTRRLHIFLHRVRMSQAILLPNRANEDLHLTWATFRAILSERGLLGVWYLLCISSYSLVASVDNVIELSHDHWKEFVVHTLAKMGINMISSPYAQSIGAGHGIGPYPYARVTPATELQDVSSVSKPLLVDLLSDDEATETETVEVPSLSSLSSRLSTHVVRPNVPSTFSLAALSVPHRSAPHLPPSVPRVVAPTTDVVAAMTLPHSSQSPISPCVLTYTTFVSLLSLLPPLARVSSWRMVYNLNQGASISVLYKQTQACSPCILVIRTGSGSVFGYYSHGPLAPANGSSWTGSPRSFPFTLVPVVNSYPFTAANRFMCLSTPTQFSCGGGGGCALWLDASLESGRTETSETYGNPPLCADAAFKVQMLELWTLDPP